MTDRVKSVVMAFCSGHVLNSVHGTMYGGNSGPVSGSDRETKTNEDMGCSYPIVPSV